MTNQPYSRAFNAAVSHIAARVLPQGFDVASDAPSTFPALVSHFKRTGRILVWNGASDSTIFGDAETNFAFRAWHDSKHVLFNLPFTPAGEAEACKRQCEDVRALYGNGKTADLFCALLRAEIIGQLEYKEAHGFFPLDQAGFVRAYIADRESAICGFHYGASAEV